MAEYAPKNIKEQILKASNASEGLKDGRIKESTKILGWTIGGALVISLASLPAAVVAATVGGLYALATRLGITGKK